VVHILSQKNSIANHFLAKNFTIWLGDFDEELNKKAYIVPGLGDAGDLAYGYKT